MLDGVRHLRGSDAPVEGTEWITALQTARTEYRTRRTNDLPTFAGRTPIHTYELAQAIADEAADDATIIYDSYQGSLYLTDAVEAIFPGQVLDAGPRVALGQGVGMSFGAGIARPGKQIISLIGDGGIGLAGMDIETLTRYEVPAVLVVLNNSSWGGNALMHDDLQPHIGPWDMTPNLRYDQVFEPLGCHVERVDDASQLRPALRRAMDSGKVPLVDVIADSESVEVSVPWLRLRIGEFYSRGLDDLSPRLRRHFEALSAVEVLRLHKSALGNGTRIPMAFMAGLCGRSEEELAGLAKRVGYRY